jgi:hypothetical protein
VGVRAAWGREGHTLAVYAALAVGCGPQPERAWAPLLLTSADALGYREDQRVGPAASGDGELRDFFGSSVAMSGDIAILGAPGDDVGAAIDQGSAYIYVREGTVWVRSAKLTGSTSTDGDAFGTSVAISGTTALVGAPYDDAGGIDRGSAYVFVRSGNEWVEEARLKAAGGALGDWFGTTVALSGNTALIGAPWNSPNADAVPGAVFVFVRSGGIWTEEARLAPSDGDNTDAFGARVALESDVAVVGAPYDDIGTAQEQGSAYVFTRSGTLWTEEAKLSADDGAARDWFGCSVSVSGGTALVGAAWHDHGGGTGSDGGAAYVFVHDGSTWAQQAELVASDGMVLDAFGRSVAMELENAVVGAPGRAVGVNDNQGGAYLFARTGSAWQEVAQLTASAGHADQLFGSSVVIGGDAILVGSPESELFGVGPGSSYAFTSNGAVWTESFTITIGDGAGFSDFGTSVAVRGDRAAVGAPGANNKTGAAYVFGRGSGWIEEGILMAKDGTRGDRFGSSVALFEDTLLVGAVRQELVGTDCGRGAVYVFAWDGSAWIEQVKLAGDDPSAGDGFGGSVALSGDTALVGAPFEVVEANTYQGSVYVFVRNGDVWMRQAKLVSGDGCAGDLFGSSVALEGDTALLGAMWGDTTGAAYVFERTGNTWAQQVKLAADDGGGGDAFGASVALSGGTALVGAYAHPVGANRFQGAAYAFVRDGSTWTQEAELAAPDGGLRDFLGYHVALSGDIALVSPRPDSVSGGLGSGLSYLFVRSERAWAQQLALSAWDGAAADLAAYSVAVDGVTTLIGNPGAAGLGLCGNPSEGAAYFGTIETVCQGDSCPPESTGLISQPGSEGCGCATGVSPACTVALAIISALLRRRARRTSTRQRQLPRPPLLP